MPLLKCETKTDFGSAVLTDQQGCLSIQGLEQGMAWAEPLTLASG